MKMKDNEMELNGLIEEVLAQIREREYGQKIYSHYQYSFSLLKSVAVDLGTDGQKRNAHTGNAVSRCSGRLRRAA